MILSQLVDDFVTTRSASGLFIGTPEVLACAVNAVRFYLGWADLADPFAVDLESVDSDTDLTAGEWAMIGPLFRLYCEREHAIVMEASAGLGAQAVGRASSEVASAIEQAELALPQLAYVEPVFIVGIPGHAPC